MARHVAIGALISRNPSPVTPMCDASSIPHADPRLVDPYLAAMRSILGEYGTEGQKVLFRQNSGGGCEYSR